MATLSRDQVLNSIHPRQHSRFGLALVAAILLAPLMALVAIFGTLYFLLFPLIVLVLWISTEIFFASMTGNTIRVSKLNYPRIHELTRQLKEDIGVDREIAVFVYQQGEFNAFAVRFFARRGVFLNSEILETGVSDDEIRWIVGRFVGYWRMQADAGALGLLIRLAQRFWILNAFIYPYDRAMVYSGDRLALSVIDGDISTTISAMQKLFVGRQLGYSVNPVGVVEQHRLVKGNLFAFLARVGSTFPHMTARYVDLLNFAKRRFSDRFARFSAENPGLQEDDLEYLSGDGTSGAVVVGYILLGGSALMALFFFFSLMSLFSRGY